MKEALSLLCKTGNGLAHAYVKLDVKERCALGDQKRAEVVGSNLLAHPPAWLLPLGVWISLTLASGREG